MRRAVAYALVAPGILLLPGAALACAVCVDGSKLDLGFLWSALFLITLPVVMTGLVGGWVYYASRDRQRLASAGDPPGDGPRSTAAEGHRNRKESGQ